MKSSSHANNIVLRRDIYIHSLNWCLTDQTFLSCKRNMVCNNSVIVWLCKGRLRWRKSCLGKRGYSLSNTQSMVLFHVKPTDFFFFFFFWADRKRSSGFFDGVRNVAGCIYYSRKWVSDYCIFSFWCHVLTQKSSHTSQKMKQHDISSSSL